MPDFVSRFRQLAERAADALLAALLIGGIQSCSESGTGLVAEASVLAMNSPALLVGVVGTPAAILPSVITRDSKGNAVARTSVRFTVAEFGASLVTFDVASDGNGVATMPGWKFPPFVGTTNITASSAHATGVLFRATSRAGAPASLTKLTGDAQTIAAGDTVKIAPLVRVADQFGNAVAGAQVTFAIDSGDGSLKAPTSVSDSAGTARAPAWRLNAVGRHALSARATGTAPVVFTASAISSAPRCGSERILAVSAVYTAQLAAGDCVNTDGRPYQLFTTTTLAGEFTFDLKSSAFDTHLEILDADGTPIATNDNATKSSSNSAIRGLFGAGMLSVVAGAARPGATGAYSLGYKAGFGGEACEDIFLTRGIETLRAIAQKPCDEGSPQSTDRFRIYLRGGSSFKVFLQDQGYSVWDIQLIDSGGHVVAVSSAVGYYETELLHRVTADGFYTIRIVCGDTYSYYKLFIY